MNDKEIDEMLGRAAGAGQEVDPALLSRAASSMTASLRPVQPLAPAWVLASWLFSISAIIAISGAWWLGFYGVQELDAAEIASIFPVLAIFTWLAALLCVAELTPGGLRWMNPVMRNPAVLLVVTIAIWIGVAAFFFRDYDMAAFVPEGVVCLRAGLMMAIPTGVGSWLVLRRGFAVNPAGAGLAAGTLGGLAGLVMLEMHCPNFLAPHVMVWHTAVVPVSGLSGAILARIATRR